MKKLLLSAAIACCGYAGPLVTPLAQAKIKISAKEQAALAETRFKSLVLAADSSYRKLKLNDFLHVVFSLKDYRKTDEQSSHARSVFAIELRSPLTGEAIAPPFELILDSTITHTPAMLENDRIAHIASRFTIDPAGSEKLDPRTVKVVKNLLRYLSIDTDLLEDERIRERFTVEPFSMEDEKVKGRIDYAGLNIAAEYNQNDLSDMLYDYAATFHSGRLRATLSDDPLPAADGSTDEKETPVPAAAAVTTLEIAPFSGTLNTSKDRIEAKTSAIDIRFDSDRKPRENVRMRIDALTIDGDKLAWDDTIRDFHGTRRYAANGIRVDNADLPVPIAFKTLAVSTRWRKADGRYDLLTRIHIAPDIDLAALFGVPVPKIEDLSLAFGFERLSGEAIRAMNDGIRLAAMHDTHEKDAPIKRNIHTAVSELLAHKARGTVALSLATDAGTLRANAALGLKKGVDTASDEWKKALDALSENDTPAALQKLLGENLELKGKIVVPKAILGVIGATGLAKLMGGPYLKTEGDDYVIDFISEKGKLRVNGKVLPLELP